MEYSNTYFQGMGLDAPFMEERNLCSSVSALAGSFQHQSYNPSFPPMSWSTTDPTLLQANEHPWLNRLKMGPAGGIGVDSDGHLSYQRPNAAMHHNQQLNLPMDIMFSTIPSDPFSFGGDVNVVTHPQWVQMCSLSSDEYLNDAIPQLISDSAAQHPCMYTSSSECLQEADSSCSSVSRSCLVGGTSSDESTWRNSDVLQGNLGGSVAGFPLDEFPDDSSSVAADIMDTQDSSGHALTSLVRMPGPAVECVPLPGPVSWMSTGDVESPGSVANQHVTTLDPLLASLSSQNNHGLPPYKRQRAGYTLENIRIPNMPLSQPLIPGSLSQSISTRSLKPDHPAVSLNITDALYKDFHFSRKFQTPYSPRSADHEVGGFASKKDLLDHDSRSQRKPNATSIEPQSVAARHRRKKITERVRVLEKLIPGGNKMDTASMLDESIEYVKFLQLQVQLLESLADMSEGSPTTSAPSFCKENMDGGKDGFVTRIGSFGSHASQSCASLQEARPAASPLILSEILQQQLFKQKLCLVSLRQCGPRLVDA